MVKFIEALQKGNIYNQINSREIWKDAVRKFEKIPSENMANIGKVPNIIRHAYMGPIRKCEHVKIFFYIIPSL